MDSSTIMSIFGIEGVEMDLMTTIGMLIIAIEFFYFIRNKNQAVKQSASGVLITTGILFTFIGISLGLWNFNANDIDTSLPSLLSGIKTAFFASATGVLAALIMKFKDLSYIDKTTNTKEEETGQTIDNLVSNQIKQQATLEAIHASLAGNEDSSLVAQTKLLRVDNNEKMDALRKDFKEFATTMAENNSKAFIKALEDVIKDFNQKITEQFGENFKQLNEAVGKTVEWQENYKNQMSQSIEVLTQITSSLQKEADNYDKVVQNSTEFTKVANDMKDIIITINAQKSQMETVIRSLSDMVAKVSVELPIIGVQTTEMIEKVALSSSQMISTMETSNIAVTSLVDNQIKHIETTNETIIQNLSKNNDALTEKLNESLKHTTGEIEKQVSLLDKELENSLKNSLETLGQQLASLSNKFVSDYTPLTEQLKRIVEMSKNLK